MAISSEKTTNFGFFCELKSAVLLSILVLLNTIYIVIIYFRDHNYTVTSVYDTLPITTLYFYFASSSLMFFVLVQNAANSTFKKRLKKQGMMKENVSKFKLTINRSIAVCFFAVFVSNIVLTFLDFIEDMDILLFIIGGFFIAPTMISIFALNIFEYPLKLSKKISPAYVPMFLIIQIAVIPIIIFDSEEAYIFDSYALLLYPLTIFLVLIEIFRFQKIKTNYLKNSKEKFLPFKSQSMSTEPKSQSMSTEPKSQSMSTEPKNQFYMTILSRIIIFSVITLFINVIIIDLFSLIVYQSVVIFSIHLFIFIINFILLNLLIIYSLKTRDATL